MVVFYREHDQLWLRLGENSAPADDALELEWRLVEATETHLERHVREDGFAELTVRVPVIGPIILRYPSGPSVVSLADDPTPFTSYEDWDFGLFIRNVLADDRNARIFING
jgi:hypothetical protein